MLKIVNETSAHHVCNDHDEWGVQPEGQKMQNVPFNGRRAKDLVQNLKLEKLTFDAKVFIS